jgi:flagellar hook-associated protein 1 FlgK
MSDLLSLGLSGLTAYRSALAAVGENVANAETPGFTRRSVRLQPALASGAASDPVYRPQIQFGGVSAAAIVRGWDMFRATEARHAAAAAGRGEVREQWLSSVEDALDDGPAGIGSRITGFFNAADALAAAPNDNLNRNRVLLALEDVAGAFRTTADGLRRISGGIGAAAQLDVDKLNQSLAALSQINTTLLTSQPGGTARASLEDDRDRLIDAISQRIDVETVIGAEGTARLALADPPGATILGGGDVAAFNLAAASDGRLTLAFTTAAGTSAVTPVTGRLAGYMDAASATADRRADLDALAADFTAQVNAWSAAGLDAGGSAGAPLLAATAGAASMRALASDPAAVPAASPDGRSNGNLLALSALRGDGGAESRWTAIVAGHGQQLAGAKSEHAAASAWRDNSFAALDEVTGVDLDREAADLLRYQQAYSAAARIVQVGRETLDAVLALF